VDWTAYVDSYCERLAPGLWGEPLNTVSNLAFLVAALATWRLAGSSGQPRVVRTLAVLLGLIFIASTAFHALATRWSGAADTGFILVFVLFYVACFLHTFLGTPWRRSWLAAPAFLAFTVVVVVAFGWTGFSGLSYLPPLIGLFGFAALLAARRHPQWSRFAVAGGLFGVSLSLRSADHAVCGSFPSGTHFLWHLLNACVLYLVAHTAARAPRPRLVSGAGG
jgi:drug/metabolite transporter (DMT)-like permease